MTLSGKVAVVTGGGAGIGRAICLRLASEGCQVGVLDISRAAAARTAESAGRALAVDVDVTNSASVDEAVARVERELGAISIFVNNAGAVGGAHLKRVGARLAAQRSESEAGRIQTPLDALVRLSDGEWRNMLAVHLDGTFHGTRAAARVMAPRARGVIVNMASVCGVEGCAGHPHYSAAKAAILGFTRSVAKELIVQGVRVNALAPGYVDTATPRDGRESQRRDIAARTPAQRLADPDEVASAVVFLASEDSAYFVGATLSPNGGLVTAV
jgi:NAD(P)-dependent dehydrogenase (short-subunit alcohol dehydrogenase family)